LNFQTRFLGQQDKKTGTICDVQDMISSIGSLSNAIA
jgi:hypothetical protein